MSRDMSRNIPLSLLPPHLSLLVGLHAAYPASQQIVVVACPDGDAELLVLESCLV